MALARFFSRRKAESVPEQSSLRDRIVFAIETYLRVRGINELMLRDTVLVVRKDFQSFMMHTGQELENADEILGVYRLQDADCFAEFKKIYTDPLLRSAALGKITLGHLADQLADQIMQQCAAARAQADQLAHSPKEQLMLSAPVTVETK
ncbi:MAG: hypothetical protein FJ145_05785 [Deltaproteobacteria bacterium]|nr:hypothetical protein [Deltaproteobacteria bacterium]